MAKFKSNFLCTVCFVLVGISVQAQSFAPFAIIKDKDGYVNIRDSGSINAKVIDKLIDNQVFEDQSQFGYGNDEWIYISYGDKGSGKGSVNRMEDEKTGYIHKSRILYLDKLPQLKRKIVTRNSAEFENDTLKLVIKTGKFISREHTLEEKEGYVSRIDNVYPWGIDGIVPESLEEIKSISITYKNQIYVFPEEALSGILSPDLDDMHVILSINNTIFVIMSNGDGAGSYNVVWTIQNNKVISQFMNRDF